MLLLCKISFATSIVMIMFAQSAYAAEPVAGTPDFLLKFHYATDNKACVAVEESDALVVDEIGVWGNEFSCKFLDFAADREQANGEAFLYISRVSCSDDSGIYRPDLLTIFHDSDLQTVSIQSQNEYVVEEAVRLAGKEPPKNYVSADYKLCETN